MSGYNICFSLRNQKKYLRIIIKKNSHYQELYAQMKPNHTDLGPFVQRVSSTNDVVSFEQLGKSNNVVSFEQPG